MAMNFAASILLSRFTCQQKNYKKIIFERPIHLEAERLFSLPTGKCCPIKSVNYSISMPTSSDLITH
jgi:hypothetical protein